jgi:hypothetical protein
MAEIMKFVATWSGFSGAPAYSTFYARDFTAGAPDQSMADGFLAKLDTYLDAVGAFLPVGVSLLVNPQVEIIEETDGSLQGFLSISPDFSRSGSSTDNWSAASGVCVNWYTDLVRGTRRMRGRTFFVPMFGAMYDSTGTLDNTKRATLQTATNTFISQTGSGDMGVWGRPTTPNGTDGVWAAVTSARINDKVAILTSRRD